jgi:hypothetical protein
MPRIRAMIWNIQNLGLETNFRSAWPRLARFIANAVAAAGVEVLLIEKLSDSRQMKYRDHKILVFSKDGGRWHGSVPDFGFRTALHSTPAAAFDEARRTIDALTGSNRRR